MMRAILIRIGSRSRSRCHTCSTEFRFRRSERFAASTAPRSVKRQAVVHDCVLVAVSHPCELFIAQTYRREQLIQGSMLQWNVPSLTKFLSRFRRFQVEASNPRELFLVKHRHFSYTAPAPQWLHPEILIGRPVQSSQCMVRRVAARISLGEKTSLRQCIRPLVEPRAPGQDEFRCVSILTSRPVVEDHYQDQVVDTPL
jgi:hypothetical protein